MTNEEADQIDERIAARTAARKASDVHLFNELTAQLRSDGIKLTDTTHGTIWEKNT